MLIAQNNIKEILAHPSLGVPIYGLGNLLSIPAKFWVQNPIESMVCVIGGSILMSSAEKFVPSSVTSWTRGLSIANIGLQSTIGLYSSMTRPLNIPPSPPPPDDIYKQPRIIHPYWQIRRNFTGYDLFGGDSFSRITVDNFSSDVLETILTPHLGPRVISEIIKSLETLHIDGVFFHTDEQGLMLLHLVDFNPEKIVSFNIENCWRV